MILVMDALLFVPFKYNTSTIKAFFVLLLDLLHSCYIAAMESTHGLSEWQSLFFAMTITIAILPLLYESAIVLQSARGYCNQVLGDNYDASCFLLLHRNRSSVKEIKLIYYWKLGNPLRPIPYVESM